MQWILSNIEALCNARQCQSSPSDVVATVPPTVSLIIVTLFAQLVEEEFFNNHATLTSWTASRRMLPGEQRFSSLFLWRANTNLKVTDIKESHSCGEAQNIWQFNWAFYLEPVCCLFHPCTIHPRNDKRGEQQWWLSSHCSSVMTRHNKSHTWKK